MKTLAIATMKRHKVGSLAIIALVFTTIALFYGSISSRFLLTGSVKVKEIFRNENVNPKENASPRENSFVVEPYFKLPTDNVEIVSMISLGDTSRSGINIAVHPTGDYISDNLRKLRIWEHKVAVAIVEVLQTFADAQFVDIGANIGVHSLQAASLGRKVISVDPNQRNCELISKSLEVNGWKDRVTVVNHALDNKRSNDLLILVANNIGGSYLVPGDEIVAKDSITMSISTILFDDLLTILDSEIVIVKIDIEGAENRALQSATKFFKTVKVPVVFMEWTRGHIKRSPAEYEELLNFFYTHNYNAYDLSRPKNLLTRSSYGSWPMDIVWMR